MSMTWMTAAAWLAHSAIGGSLLLLLTWAIARRTQQPVRRQRLAEWGVAAALVVAALSWAPAWLVLEWAGSPSTPPLPKSPAPDLFIPQVQVQGLEHPEFAFREDRVPQDGPALDRAAMIPEPPAEQPVESRQPTPPTAVTAEMLAMIPPWLVAVYGLIAAWFWGRWLLGHVALARLLRGAAPAPEPITQLFAALTSGQQRPRLLVSRRLRVPVSCGLWRPTVVLPAAMCGCPDPRKLRWVFVHELTHLERRDAWSGLLFGLAQALYFFVPWFWWLRQQARLCQEFIADAAAVQPRQAADYAEFLLSLVAAPAVPRAATGVSGQSSDLYRRVTMLLQEPLRVEKRCPRRWSLTAAVGLLALAVLVAGVGWRTEAAAATAPDDIIIIIKRDGPDKPEPTPTKKILLRVPDLPQPVYQAIPGDRVVQPNPAVPVDRVVQQFVPGENKIILRQVTPGQPGMLLWKKVDSQLDELREALKQIENQGDKVDAKEIRRIILKALDKIEAKSRQIEWKVAPVVPGGPAKVNGVTWHLGEAPGQKAIRWEIVPGDKVIRMAPQLPGSKVPGQIELILPQGKKVDAQLLEDYYRKLRALEQQARAPEFQAQKSLDQQQQALAAERLARTQLDKIREDVIDREKEKQGLATLAAKSILGLQVETPGAVLADQLNLPKNVGLVVIKVLPGTAAEKTGFQVNDVLIRINKVAVASDPQGLQKWVGEFKVATFYVTLLRKGAQVVLVGKNVEVEPPSKNNPPLQTNKVVPMVAKDQTIVVQNDKNVLTTAFRTKNRFTIRHQEGSLIITITGKVTDAKTYVGEIHIQDGTVVSKYDNFEQVPVQYRDKAVHLFTLGTQRLTQRLTQQQKQ